MVVLGLLFGQLIPVVIRVFKIYERVSNIAGMEPNGLKHSKANMHTNTGDLN